jgi:hypothetical protein
MVNLKQIQQACFTDIVTQGQRDNDNYVGFYKNVLALDDNGRKAVLNIIVERSDYLVNEMSAPLYYRFGFWISLIVLVMFLVLALDIWYKGKVDEVHLFGLVFCVAFIAIYFYDAVTNDSLHQQANKLKDLQSIVRKIQE